VSERNSTNERKCPSLRQGNGQLFTPGAHTRYLIHDSSPFKYHDLTRDKVKQGRLRRFADNQLSDRMGKGHRANLTLAITWPQREIGHSQLSMPVAAQVNGDVRPDPSRRNEGLSHSSELPRACPIGYGFN